MRPLQSRAVKRLALKRLHHTPAAGRGAAQLTAVRRGPGQCDVSVDQTLLFSLRENAIAKEPGLGYPERWRCVSRLGLFNGGLDSFESSPYQTLSRGAFSAPSLVTPTR